MRYRERLCIIFMRDNGPRHSFRVRRGRFFLMLAFLVLQYTIFLRGLQRASF